MRIAMFLMLSLAMTMVTALSSCDQSDLDHPNNTVTVTQNVDTEQSQNDKDHDGRPFEIRTLSQICPGGGDDEDPIIFGGVKKQNDDPVAGATVNIYNASSPIPWASTTTDSEGEYCLNVVSDDYYLEVSAAGFSTETTSTFTLARDTTINFTLN